MTWPYTFMPADALCIFFFRKKESMNFTEELENQAKNYESANQVSLFSNYTSILLVIDFCTNLPEIQEKLVNDSSLVIRE